MYYKHWPIINNIINIINKSIIMRKRQQTVPSSVPPLVVSHKCGHRIKLLSIREGCMESAVVCEGGCGDKEHLKNKHEYQTGEELKMLVRRGVEVDNKMGEFRRYVLRDYDIGEDNFRSLRKMFTDKL